MGEGAYTDVYKNKAFVLDVFSNNGTEIVNIFDGTPSSYGFYERNNLTIYENGILRNWGSGGAGIDSYTTYHFTPGNSIASCTEQLSSNRLTNTETGRDVPYFEITDSNGSTREIVMDQFSEIVESYNAEPALQLEWHSLEP